MTRWFALLIVLALIAAPAVAYEGPRGVMRLLDMCPGDETKDEASDSQKDEAFLGAIVTPILGALVTQGLKTSGEKLKQAAKEASVEVLHAGDYFYAWSEQEAFGMVPKCILVATRGTKADGDLVKLTAGYDAKIMTVDTKKKSRDPVKWQTAAGHLEAALTKLGFSAASPPGVVGVFDIELSESKTTARLQPRFIALDHSIREKRRDSRNRTFTFEFTLSTPENTYGKPVIKVDGLAIGEPLRHDDARRPVSEWFALPPVDASIKKKLEELKAAKTAAEQLKRAAKLAGTTAEGMGVTLPDLKEDPPCPAAGKQLEKDWRTAYVSLEKAKTPGKGKKPDAKEVAKWAHTMNYYASCREFHATTEKKNKLEISENAKARTYDVEVVVKEFRKRPAAQFWGEVLASSDLQKGVTSAVLGAIDPATRAAAEKTETEALAKLKEEYEKALVAAELAMVAHAAAAPAEQAGKFIEMESKKRAANRLAVKTGSSLPYVEAGLWF